MGLPTCCLVLAALFLCCCAMGAMTLEDFSTVDGWKVWPEAWGGKAEFQAAQGPDGSGAIRFTGPGIIYRELAPVAAAKSKAKGISFWVKGDGSQLYGTIVVGPAGKGSWEQGFVHAGMTGHAFYFPLADTKWHRVTAAWTDFIPEGPQPAICSPGGLAPADIRVVRIGNRWKYWRNYDAYPRFSYAVGRIDLIDEAPAPRPAAAPASLAKVLEKMRKGESVRILCAGDSITAGAGANANSRYWVLLQPLLRKRFANERITVEGWGIGGATMLDALPWLDWMLGKDPPDLVTAMFGTNDCSCYEPAFFRWCLGQFLDRTGCASGGRTAVLPIATPLGLKEYATKTDPFAEAVRQVTAERKIACFDLHAAMKGCGEDRLKPCLADSVHLNDGGHEFVAGLLADFLCPPASDAPTSEDKR